ncbi:hypothetical protein B0H10DRAFT_1940208 [Mycena sp. CBHHK59/15]|nr:hypothetical protein B0H10DRAFT_1940208 [Mycena sp. CBHHK59/15]
MSTGMALIPVSRIQLTILYAGIPDNNPLFGMFQGMMQQFFNAAMASGNMSAVTSDNTNTPSQPAGPAPLPVLHVPPIAPYVSARLPSASTGHPAIPSNLVATQPMLGISGLAIPLAGHSNNPRRSLQDLTPNQISQTNASCRAAAAAHLPMGTGLQVRQPRRTRGPAVCGLVLHQGPQSTLEKVSSVNPAGIREIRVLHMVQAYQNSREVVLFKSYASSFSIWLEGYDLRHRYVLPEHTKITQILAMTVQAMRTGPRAYSFGAIPPGPVTRQQHESLDLQLLAYGAAHLRRESITPDMTLADLFSPMMKNLYAIPTLCIENDYFVLHSIVRYNGLRFNDANEGAWPRTHRCLTTRQNTQFSEYLEVNDEEGDSDASATSGGIPEGILELDSDDDDMPAAPLLAAATLPVRHPLSSRARISSTVVPSTTSSIPISAASAAPAGSALITTPPTSLLPAAMFVSEPGPYANIFDQHDVSTAVYRAAGDDGRLELEAASFDDLGSLYMDKLRVAAEKRDFTAMLCPRRMFRILNPEGGVLSFGDGIEQETIWTALNCYFKNPGAWCLQQDEDRMSLAISMPLRLASAIAPHRLEELRVFGALIGLAIISGVPPGPMTPALLQYAVNGCNLDALTPSFVAAGILLSAVGPRGDLAPFQSLIINTLTSRLLLFHIAMRTSTTFSLLNCFILRSWALSCMGIQRLRLSVLVLISPVQTGFHLASTTEAEMTPHFGTLGSGIDAVAIFKGFLQRTGIPCHGLLENGKAHFHPDVISELSNIHAPSFCPRMFCWATTGTPFLDPDYESPTRAIFVLPGDENYNPDPTIAAPNMAQGTLSFRTCFRAVRIPISKLIALHQATYPTQDEFTLQDAIDNWFLLQILNGIGKASMI